MSVRGQGDDRGRPQPRSMQQAGIIRGGVIIRRPASRLLLTSPQAMSTQFNAAPTAHSATTRAFVHWIRLAAPYIHAFRGKTFVIAFGGEVVADETFLGIIHDLNLLHSLGILLTNGPAEHPPATFSKETNLMLLIILVVLLLLFGFGGYRMGPGIGYYGGGGISLILLIVIILLLVKVI